MGRRGLRVRRVDKGLPVPRGPERLAVAYKIALQEKRDGLDARGFVLYGKGRALSDVGERAKLVFGRSPHCRLLVRVGAGADKEYWVEGWALCVFNALRHRFAVGAAEDVAALIRAAISRCLPDEELQQAILSADDLGGLEGGSAVQALLLPKEAT